MHRMKVVELSFTYVNRRREFVRYSSLIACLMIFVVSYLTSCTSESSNLTVNQSPSVTAEQSPYPTNREVSPSHNTIEEQETEVLEAKSIYNPDITFDELKKSVRLGERIDETIKILGNDYDQYPSYYNDDWIFRYNFANVEDYSYEFTHIHDNIVNDLDKEGLLNEDLNFQLRVFVLGDIASTYAITYKHDDGKIHVYYEWMNGYSKEDIYE